MKKIDIKSEEFQLELELTKQFTSKVLEEYNLVFNPNDEVTESIQMGLARNKIMRKHGVMALLRYIRGGFYDGNRHFSRSRAGKTYAGRGE